MMRQILITLIIITMIPTSKMNAQIEKINFLEVKNAEHLLDDVMELIDTTIVKDKLQEIEKEYKENPNELNMVRLGIIYHETALNLGFLAKTKFKGYSKKSYEILTELQLNENTTKELLPFITSYRASALSLLGGETMKLRLVGNAFKLFEISVQQYGNLSYSPEFLRGSVAENLPWFFFSKKKFAKKDFQSIIDKQKTNSDYANSKIMSFTYWAWANQRQNQKHRIEAIKYLDMAIKLDPFYSAGRQKAEELKDKLMK